MFILLLKDGAKMQSRPPRDFLLKTLSEEFVSISIFSLKINRANTMIIPIHFSAILFPLNFGFLIMS